MANGGKAQNPNIMIILNDDMGFSDIGCYGGEIETPNLDRLAANGLRYSQFYNTARCSPSRASLLTGLHPHQTGVGILTYNNGPEGYAGNLNKSCVTVAEVLKANNYKTYLSGKWHVSSNLTQPTDSWPLQRGFDYFFGTIIGAGSFYHPNTLTRGNDNIEHEAENDPSFFYTDAISNQAAAYVRQHSQENPDAPFFQYVAYTAPHWPLHAPDQWIDKYKGRYAEGYEALRQQRLKRMQALGIVPKGGSANTPMEGGLPTWEQLTEEQRQREARSMEVYAAMVDNMDHHIGRMLDYLRQSGQLDNTFVLFMSDNGADGNSPIDLPGNREWMAKDFDNSLENMGRKGSYIDYGAQWAQVGATPFPFFKGFTSQGGTTVPVILSHSSLKAQAGQLNGQFFHVMDVMPTILELAGVKHPGTQFRGREVQPMQGVSMLPGLHGQAMPERAVGWELFGRRALRKGDWKMTWMTAPYGTAQWQLYNLAKDPVEAHDLAKQEPAKLAELTQEWEAYVQRNNVLLGPVKIKYGFETCLYGHCFK